MISGMPASSTVRPTLYVMVGLPAAGKTTRARELESEHDALRITPDEWMIPLFGEPDAGGRRDVLEGRFVWLADRTLRAGCSVVLDFGVWSRDERSALRWLAVEADAAFELVYLPIGPVEQRRRVTARWASAPESTFELRPDDLDAYEAVFDEPDERELEAVGLDRPPAGYASWRSWMARRWPTSTD